MNNFLLRATSAVAICSLFAFSACDSEDVSPDAAVLKSQNQLDAHRSKSLNLHKSYTVEFKALNNSGVSGMAMIELMGDELKVHIMAQGLEPGMLHPQHIHGFTENNKNAVCPPMSADMNGDGLVDLSEGLPYYGNVLLPLEPFPVAPDGSVDYMQTFDISGKVNLLPLQNDVIVLHGMTVDGEYMATLPIACGMIKSSNNGM